MIQGGNKVKGIRGSVPKRHSQFMEDIRRLYGREFIIYGRYRQIHTRLWVKHKKCGYKWRPGISYFLTGSGCPNCNKNKRSTKEFLKKLKREHGDKYVPIEDYREIGTRLLIHCTQCKRNWRTLTTDLLRGRGCPRCNRPRHHSPIAIQWLKCEAKKKGIRIRHSENWGEFSIPGTRIRVDGYHKPSNTVFEFYGDRFHGNLRKYGPKQKPHPYDRKITTLRLWRKTKEREEEIKRKGFNLVTIWQSDFKRMLSK